MRIKILRLIAIVVFVIIAMNLFYTQILRGFFYYRLSTNNRIRVVPVESKRGRILDRNGIVLADNRIAFDVMVTPQEVDDTDDLFAFLSKVLGIEKRLLKDQFGRKQFAPFAPVTIAGNLTRDQVFVLEENRFRFPSLIIQENYRRYYPMNEIGAHILGYVGKINRAQVERLKDYGYTAQSVIGYSGIEESYDQKLKGAEGGLQVEVDSRGRQVRIISIKEPQSGSDVELTIDNRIQQMAFDSMSGKDGTVIVMDLDSGEILSMVSSPSYDPNIFVTKKSGLSSAIFTDPHSPLLNRAIKGLYPPGSVFKIPVAIGALETQAITPNTSFDCPGYFRLGRRQIRCAHTHGMQNLYEAIGHSCNVYFINVGLKTESDMIAKYAKLLGLGQLTQIDLPFEQKGLVPSKQQRRMSLNRGWYKGDTANLSIGQGDVMVTPIQLLRMIAAIARDGREISPYMVRSINKEEVERKLSDRILPIDPSTLETVKQGMRRTVADADGGTAHALNLEGLTVSGKTGTAQSTSTRQHHSWFVGYSISDKRRVAFCVFLEYGGSSYYAVQVARELLLKMQGEDII